MAAAKCAQMCLPDTVTMQVPDEADVVDELFGGSREQFMEVRTERAAQARAAGDRDLARRIAALRKPTVAAWLVNQLVRTSPDVVDALDSLAAQLADAHRHGSGDDLRAAGERRRELLRELENRIRELAGGAPGDAVVTQVTTTFQAALIDPAALAAVRSGRLSTAVELGEETLDRWPTHEITRAAPVAPSPPPPSPPKQAKAEPARPAAQPSGPDPALVAARARARDAVAAREQAEQELADAQAAVGAAEKKLAKARAVFDAARETHDAAREAIATARTALSGAVRAENAAERAVANLE